jgi:hypothetical protein
MQLTPYLTLKKEHETQVSENKIPREYFEMIGMKQVRNQDG